MAVRYIAGIRTYGFHSRPPLVEPPKWSARKNVGRVTTSDLLAQMHQEMMLSAAGNFSPLVFERLPDTTSEKSPPDFAA